MSLAEELLADLDEPDEAETINNEESDDEEVEDVLDIAMIEQQNRQLDETIHGVAKLRDSSELRNIMTAIERYRSAPTRHYVVGSIEHDPEYQLIVKANNITVEIDNEINTIFKYVKDRYAPRFPELESLVPIGIDYMRAVYELRNDLSKCKSSTVMPQFLPQAAIMIISVSASTTQGKALPEPEMARMLEACEMGFDLRRCRDDIIAYVESKMSFIAPNISHIVGAPTAAKLMGLAGGLTRLSQMPACNVLVLGAQKRALSGFSTSAILPHTGFIYYSDFVQKQPPDIRKKLARLVAAKSILGARVDAFHEAPEGVVGKKLREEIESKIEKWLEPPPVKGVKPLPAPVDAPSKRRGGRRARKMKERLGMTDVRRAANRMNFAEIEDDAYQADLGFSAGVLGKSSSGKVRAAVIDSKTKVRISQKLQARVKKVNAQHGGSTTIKRAVSGTASTVAFTPAQGLEITNPHAVEQRAAEDNKKYFSTTSGFTSVKKSFV